MNELVKLNKARQALAEAKSLEEIITIRDVGVAGVAWCKAAKMGPEMINDAQEIKIRSERKAGEFLKNTPKPKNQHSAGSTMEPPTLKELDVGK